MTKFQPGQTLRHKTRGETAEVVSDDGAVIALRRPGKRKGSWATARVTERDAWEIAPGATPIPGFQFFNRRS